jgi:hypothetical protein
MTGAACATRQVEVAATSPVATVMANINTCRPPASVTFVNVGPGACCGNEFILDQLLGPARPPG